MSTVQESLQLALHHHRLGELRQAETHYLQVLKREPQNADAHHLLGMLAAALDEHERALRHLRMAVAANPTAADFHANLGSVLARGGQKQEAVECYRRAVELDPSTALRHDVLGSALGEVGRAAEAEAAYREALRLDPKLAITHNNLGNALQAQKRYDEAVDAFRAALRLRPDMAEIHFNLGNCYYALESLPEATAAYRTAVALKPEFLLAHQKLGLALQAQQQHAEAVACHRRALELQPQLAEGHNFLGVALQMTGQLDEAKACYRRALELEPGNVTAQYNLASALHAESDLDAAEPLYRAVVDTVPNHLDSLSGLSLVRLARGDLNEASEYLRQALCHWPDAAEARFFRGTLLLAQEKLLEGWPDFEYRAQCRFGVPCPFSEPRWNGQEFPGKTLLVHAEYGFGDTMQFIRYDPLVRSRGRGGRVIVQVHPSIMPLLATSGFRDLVPQGKPLPHFDLQIPLMSLPGLFGTTIDTIPCEVPYLFADTKLVARWRERLAGVRGFKVGIHWQGNVKYAGDRLRSVPLANFRPLASVASVQLVSLQKGTGVEQLDEMADPFPVLSLPDLDEQGGAFMDTAAVIKNLDLIVTSDSGLAHLAGAMGVKVWLATSFSPDWRWFRRREDTPWYPTMRLFRQPALGDWESVFARIAAELSQAVAASGR